MEHEFISVLHKQVRVLNNHSSLCQSVKIIDLFGILRPRSVFGRFRANFIKYGKSG